MGRLDLSRFGRKGRSERADTPDAAPTVLPLVDTDDVDEKRFAQAGKWSGLVARLVAADIIEHASLRQPAHEEFFPSPHRPRDLDETVTVLYDRHADPARRQAPRPSRTRTMELLHTTLEAHDINARSTNSHTTVKTRSVDLDGASWTLCSEELAVDPQTASVRTHYVAGAPLRRNGARVPSAWRSVLSDEFREDAEVEVRLAMSKKHRTYLYIRSGPHLGPDFLRGIDTSTAIGRDGAVNANPLMALARDLGPVPHVVRGDAAAVMQGQRGSTGRRVEVIDLAFSRDNITQLAAVLESADVSPSGSASKIGWTTRGEIEQKLLALRDGDPPLPLHSTRWREVRVSILPNEQFAELRDHSNTHQIGQRDAEGRQGRLTLEEVTPTRELGTRSSNRVGPIIDLRDRTGRGGRTPEAGLGLGRELPRPS